MMTDWEDTEAYHIAKRGEMELRVQIVPMLDKHRTWVEQHAHGFGERAFHGMWWEIAQELPKNAALLEIGVYKGQVLSLWRMLLGGQASITGITPLDSTDGHLDEDYMAHITRIHDAFGLDMPELIVGLSGDAKVQEQVAKREFDVVYIDGGHTREVVDADLAFYPGLVKKGGWLVVDDAANDMNMLWGWFQGIQDVTDAVLAWQAKDSEFEFVGNVVHNRIYRRKI